jgi:hypothetical protein
MTTPGNEGNLVFDPEVLGAGERTLAARPEQPAATIVNGLTVEPAAFGTVPGAGAASSRTTGWVDRTKVEIARVGVEVADLKVRLGECRRLATEVNGDTQAAARLASPD